MKIKSKDRPCHFLKRFLFSIMRLFIILFCTTVFGLTTEHSFSQEIITIKEDQVVTVNEVFRIIKKQTKYGFIYPKSLFKNTPKVQLVKGDIELGELLKLSLGSNNLKFEISDDKTIKIIEGPLQDKTKVSQQNVEVKGVVTDENGMPLAGVHILEKGTNNGVATDFDGNYTLEVIDDAAILVVSYIGYVTREIEIAGRSEIDISMTPNTITLAPVVVLSTGLQEVSQEHTTGSFEQPQVQEVVKQQISDNALDLMEGRVPGLRIDRATETFTIRGRSSLDAIESGTGRDEPLIVVDGFELVGESSQDEGTFGSNAFNLLKRLNPEDIESITVLKDAAASSIWGARAANGVIVIVTKKKRYSDKPVISYTSSLSFTSKLDLHNPYAGSVDDALEVDRLNAENGLVNSPFPFFAIGPNSIGEQAYFDLANGAITQGEADAIINGLRQNDVYNEYSDYFLRTAIKNRQTLSISQGTDRFSYYASFNYDKEERNNIGDETKRLMGNINISSEIFDGVTLSAKLNYSREKTFNNGALDVAALAAYQRILDGNGNYVSMPRIHPETIAEYDATGFFPYSWDYNIKQEFDNADNESIATNIDVNASLAVQLTDNLNLQLSYNYQDGQNTRENFLNEQTYSVRSAINNSGVFYDHDADFSTPVVLDPTQQYDGFGIPQGGFLDRSNSQRTSSGGRGLLSYEGFITDDPTHHITALLGAEVRETTFTSNTLQRLYGYDDKLLTSLPVDLINRYINYYGSTRTFASHGARISKTRDRFVSYFANAGYTYKGKYNVTGSWRLDDSNLFGSSKKYRNKALWSVGGKWQIAKEDFFDVGFINELSVRATYGTGGRINKDASPFLTFSLGNDSRTGTPIATIDDLENQELRWEETTTTNIGFDFGLFNNRVYGSVEWYDKYTDDLLTTAPVNPTYGFSQLFANFGEVSNRGVDVTLTVVPVNTPKFRWTATTLFSSNKNKVERYEGADIIITRIGGSITEGDPLSGTYAYRWAGLDATTGAPQIYDVDGEILGHLDNVTNVEALEYVGQRNPKYYGSFSNTVRFKGFTLSALITYEMGHVFRRQSVNYAGFPGLDGTAPHMDFGRRWQNPGDELTTNVPAYTPVGGFGSSYDEYYSNSNIMYEKADNIRLTNLSLGYDFSQSVLNKTFFRNLYLGVNAQNLGLIWTANNDGIDPGVGNGIYSYKPRPTYSLTLRATL